MAHITKPELLPGTARPREGVENLWHEFWKLAQAHGTTAAVRASARLTDPQSRGRQFCVETGSGCRFEFGDAAKGAGLQPTELAVAALAASAASSVLAILQEEKNQQITAYEVRAEVEQGERPPHPFVAVRIHHVITGHHVDPVAVNEAIRTSEEKFCAVQAMLRYNAPITTTFEVVEARAF